MKKIKTFYTIFSIEAKIALFRYMDSLFFGLIIPLVIAITIGIFMGNKMVESTGFSFIQTSFPALITISICTTGIMGFPMTIAAYKDKKIFKRLQITPISPAILLLSQCIGCFFLVILSFLCIMATYHWGFNYKMQGPFVLFFLSYLLVICSIYSLGMLLSSVSRNMKMANMLSTIIFFPMVLFSGATIPYEAMPEKVKRLVDILPLSQGIKVLKVVSLNENVDIVPSFVYLTIMILLCVVLSVKFFKWE